jgi:hypothetical protein
MMQYFSQFPTYSLYVIYLLSDTRDIQFQLLARQLVHQYKYGNE